MCSQGVGTGPVGRVEKLGCKVLEILLSKNIGVTSVPDLMPTHPFYVIVSDGVIEFLSSKPVVDMISKFRDPRDTSIEITVVRAWSYLDSSKFIQSKVSRKLDHIEREV